MKKPLTLIPPAQAEALYDASLHGAWPRQPQASAFPRPPRSWDALEWDEDDAFLPAEGAQAGRASLKAHD